jgi:hypothetical protein
VAGRLVGGSPVCYNRGASSSRPCDWRHRERFIPATSIAEEGLLYRLCNTTCVLRPSKPATMWSIIRPAGPVTALRAGAAQHRSLPAAAVYVRSAGTLDGLLAGSGARVVDLSRRGGEAAAAGSDVVAAMQVRMARTGTPQVYVFVVFAPWCPAGAMCGGTRLPVLVPVVEPPAHRGLLNSTARPEFRRPSRYQDCTQYSSTSNVGRRPAADRRSGWGRNSRGHVRRSRVAVTQPAFTLCSLSRGAADEDALPRPLAARTRELAEIRRAQSA